MALYIALVRKDSDSDYGVEFPDFPGCVTATPVLEDVLHLAEEALRFHIEGLTEDGEPLPKPSSAAEIMADPRNREALALFVELEEAPGEVQVDVTLPEEMVQKIDAKATARGLSRSAFLMEALEEVVRKSA